MCTRRYRYGGTRRIAERWLLAVLLALLLALALALACGRDTLDAAADVSVCCAAAVGGRVLDEEKWGWRHVRGRVSCQSVIS